MGLGDRLAVLLATGLYLSYIPSQLLGVLAGGGPGPAGFWGWAQGRRWTGAGLLGTLAGLALAPFLPGEPLRLGIFLACAAAAACWLCGRAERAFGVHDDPRIVLDEVVGYWTAIAFLPARWSVWIAALVLFRVLDAAKLPPYGRLDRLPGGLGVVADDVGAGIVANVVLRVWLAFVPCFGLC